MQKKNLLLLMTAFVLTACNPESKQAQTTEAQSSPSTSDVDEAKSQAMVNDDVSAKNVLQVAAGSEAHTTLVAAVQAADLENVLANNGPFTVFAPTNEAFDKLPEGTLDELLKPENKVKLKKIVTFHAAPGEYKGELLKDGMKLFMATGHYVDVERNGDEIIVHGAKVIGTIKATNGVIHVVDKVLLPPGKS